MKLTNLKLTKKERKAAGEVPKEAESKEAYPWGLSITLETESIDKLGLDLKSFKINEKIKIGAIAEVIGISNDKTEDGDRKTIRLQIQKIGLDRGGISKAGEQKGVQKMGSL